MARAFDAIMGPSAPAGAGPSNPSPHPGQGPQAPQISPQDAMRQLQGDIAGTIKQAGYNVPAEYARDPQSAAMYLLQSGQVGGPMMRWIAPMVSRLMGRK